MPLKEQLFSFSGRLNRAPYWVISVVLWIVVVVAQVALGAAMGGPQGGGGGGVGAVGGLILLAIGIVAIWISLAVNVKRFHDRDKSGWWVLIGLVPVIGSLWILIECGFLPGTAGDNRFGSNPLG